MQRTCNWIKNVTKGTLQGSPVDPFLFVQGVSTDSRLLRLNQLYIPLVGERFDGHHFLKEAIEMGASAALWQENYPIPVESTIPIIVVVDTLVALQQLATAYRKEVNPHVIAITGSNGKTTTKDLVFSVLSVKFKTHKTQGNLNNHIGVPLTILSMPEDAEVAVIEMGMNHAGEINVLSTIAQPDIAVITNIGESHLEYLGSREGIARAKLEIREGLKDTGSLLFDGDEPLLIESLRDDPHPKVRVGWEKSNDFIPYAMQYNGFKGSSFQVKGEKSTLYHLPLVGRHNIKNALYAIAIGQMYSLSFEEINSGLQQVNMTGMRLEVSVARNGMKVINDSYNSSPTSVRSAIDTLMELDPSSEKWVFLGDMNELGEQEERYHNEIGEYIATMKISRIYTIGDRGKWITQSAVCINCDPHRIIHHFTSKKAAAKELAQEGHDGVVLLVKSSRSLQLEEVVTFLTKGRIE